MEDNLTPDEIRNLLKKCGFVDEEGRGRRYRLPEPVEVDGRKYMIGCTFTSRHPRGRFWVMNGDGELIEGKERDRILDSVKQVNDFYTERAEMIEMKKEAGDAQKKITETVEAQPVAIPETKSIPAASKIVMPVVTAEEAMAAWKQYEELKRAIVTPNDVVVIDGREFLKKSYWRKLATFFNLTDEIVKEEIERDAWGRIVKAKYHVKATAPNGRSTVGVGVCSIHDKAHEDDKRDREGRVICPGPCDGRRHFSNPEHDILSTAHTRAKNRAISDLVGGGEVSAEEVE
ncbi:MAG TPA: hypothetical protein ENG09_00135 [Candidatus Syntrophoarchaeum butanivorans]|uniref:Uncharacterized protein n=1 Tax=Candidatus Syntropharchaeum butanivorans TaxID=1839936 RepID=A0A7C1AUK9_9EURY|nr:hypothetical protein [Candidatus Syntrophoarchaeum butanivorans]